MTIKVKRAAVVVCTIVRTWGGGGSGLVRCHCSLGWVGGRRTIRRVMVMDSKPKTRGRQGREPFSCRSPGIYRSFCRESIYQTPTAAGVCSTRVNKEWASRRSRPIVEHVDVADTGWW
jgi:hypothetical protein